MESPRQTRPADHPSKIARLNPLVRRAGENVRVHSDPGNHADPAGNGQPEIRTLASSVIYTDNWTRLRRDDIERADFACVVPAENGGFYLVEEYRYPLGRRAWSFPQGSFPWGEEGTPEEL